jgi:spore germination cell wall hydrolase CwlJ-like protein
MLVLSNIRLISLLIPLAIALHMYQPKINMVVVDNSVESVVETIKEVTEVVKHTPVVKQFSTDQIKCLATNIYYEAANEPYMGQVAVARVVVNRMLHGFGSTPCKVVYAQHNVPDPKEPELLKRLCQFSWVCEGKTTPNVNSSQYQKAEEIARKVLLENYGHDIIPNNVLYFHATYVNPQWTYKKLKRIGNHIFYMKGKEKEIENSHIKETNHAKI